MTHSFDQDGLFAAVRRMGEALVAGDLAALDALWSEGYVFTAPIGLVLTKAQRLDFVLSGRRPLERLDYRDLVAYDFGTTAVVLGTYSETAPGGGAGETGRLTVVFAQQEQGWRMVAGHNSPLPQ